MAIVNKIDVGLIPVASGLSGHGASIVIDLMPALIDSVFLLRVHGLN